MGMVMVPLDTVDGRRSAMGEEEERGEEICTPCPHLDLGLLVSRTGREEIC